MVGRRRSDGWVITAACAMVGNSKDIANRETLNGRISITQSNAKNGHPITDSVYTIYWTFILVEENRCTALLGMGVSIRLCAIKRCDAACTYDGLR